MPRRTRQAVAACCATALLAAVPAAAAHAQSPAVLSSQTTTHLARSVARPADPDFSGMVALSNCSGSVVRWTTSQPSDQALVLTNGHCHGDHFLGAHDVIVNQPYVRSVDLLNSDGSVAGTVDTTRVLYATMWGTDVTLYQLGQTYADLQSSYGVPAITVASTKPAPRDQPIAVVSGYWRTEYDCNLNGFAYRLHEYVWTWRKSLRYSDGGCQVIGGTSGSPVLDTDRVMIGINNTINEDGERCTLDNPCEQNRRGHISVHIHRGYGEETWWFYTCLTGNALDLSKPGCMLAKP